jgi:hypothetical protein
MTMRRRVDKSKHALLLRVLIMMTAEMMTRAWTCISARCTAKLKHADITRCHQRDVKLIERPQSVQCSQTDELPEDII